MHDAVVVELSPNPVASVVWLHGLGADGHDFEAVVPMLGLPAAAPVRFVFPHAPVQPVTMNGGMAMRAWYDVYGIGADVAQDEAGIRRCHERLQNLVAQERSRAGIRRLVLAGFSQGGAMALYTGLRLEEPAAGLLSLSSWLPLAERLAGELSDAGRRTPILMMHGSQDQVVPLALAEASRGRLLAAGCAVDWRTYPMPHTVVASQLADIGAWLQERLAL